MRVIKIPVCFIGVAEEIPEHGCDYIKWAVSKTTSSLLLMRCRRFISKSSHPDSENKYPLEKALPRHEDAGGGGGVLPQKGKDSFERKYRLNNQAGLPILELCSITFLFLP
jgi:hypothetical protein